MGETLEEYKPWKSWNESHNSLSIVYEMKESVQALLFATKHYIFVEFDYGLEGVQWSSFQKEKGNLARQVFILRPKRDEEEGCCKWEEQRIHSFLNEWIEHFPIFWGFS